MLRSLNCYNLQKYVYKNCLKNSDAKIIDLWTLILMILKHNAIMQDRQSDGWCSRYDLSLFFSLSIYQPRGFVIKSAAFSAARSPMKGAKWYDHYDVCLCVNSVFGVGSWAPMTIADGQVMGRPTFHKIISHSLGMWACVCGDFEKNKRANKRARVWVLTRDWSVIYALISFSPLLLLVWRVWRCSTRVVTTLLYVFFSERLRDKRWESMRERW